MQKFSRLSVFAIAIASIFLLTSCATKNACSLENVKASLNRQNREASAICKASFSSDKHLAYLQKQGAEYVIQNDMIIIALPTDKIFEPASSEFKLHYTRILDPLVRFLRQYPAYEINVYGNTDPIASETFNQHLSTEQAMKVTGYLWTQCLTLDGKRRIKFKGNGELKPISTNTKLAGMAKNRNIMIVIHPKRAKRVFQLPKRKAPAYHKVYRK